MTNAGVGLGASETSLGVEEGVAVGATGAPDITKTGPFPVRIRT